MSQHTHQDYISSLLTSRMPTITTGQPSPTDLDKMSGVQRQVFVQHLWPVLLGGLDTLLPLTWRRGHRVKSGHNRCVH